MRTNIGNLPVVTVPVQGVDISPTADILAQAVRFGVKKVTNFGLAIAAAPTTKEEIVHVADGAGVINGFHCSVIVPGSGASITLDLKKNGTTVLSAVVTLTNSSTAGLIYNGTVSVPTFVAGDVLSIALTEGSNTGMSGVAAWVNLVETVLPQ